MKMLPRIKALENQNLLIWIKMKHHNILIWAQIFKKWKIPCKIIKLTNLTENTTK